MFFFVAECRSQREFAGSLDLLALEICCSEALRHTSTYDIAQVSFISVRYLRENMFVHCAVTLRYLWKWNVCIGQKSGTELTCITQSSDSLFQLWCEFVCHNMRISCFLLATHHDICAYLQYYNKVGLDIGLFSADDSCLWMRPCVFGIHKCDISC